MWLKEMNEKAGLKLNMKKKKTKILASGLIISLLIEGEKVEAKTVYFIEFQNHCGWWLQL